MLPAAQIVTDATSHRVYYEARPGLRHEERFEQPSVIAVATWERDRVVGVQPAHGGADAWLTTKPFELRGLAVVLNLDTRQACSSVTVCAVLPRPIRSSNRKTIFDLCKWGAFSTCNCRSSKVRRKLLYESRT